MPKPYKIDVLNHIDEAYPEKGGAKEFLKMLLATRPIEIAIHYNVSQRTVERWIKEYRDAYAR